MELLWVEPLQPLSIPSGESDVGFHSLIGFTYQSTLLYLARSTDEKNTYSIFCMAQWMHQVKKYTFLPCVCIYIYISNSSCSNLGNRKCQSRVDYQVGSIFCLPVVILSLSLSLSFSLCVVIILHAKCPSVDLWVSFLEFDADNAKDGHRCYVIFHGHFYAIIS